MIVSFRDSDCRSIFNQKPVRHLPIAVQTVVLRKLQMLNSAVELFDLRSPPGNRLEALRSDRAGQYSIRVNDQWRLCFRWTTEGPSNVELVDYH